MMKFKNIITIAVITLLSMQACDDPYNDSLDDDADYVNNDNQHEPTELDQWLYSNFTAPFNIEVKYRWDASELDLYKTLVPPKPEKVQEVMEVARQVWIDPYVSLAGAGFIQKYCPKQFMLVGSPEYNFDGTMKLGTAEGGRKVVLYVVNDFEKTDQASVKRLVHTVEHEFAHILHQNLSYPSEFKEITPGDYTANWSMIPLSEARARGFITSYAMSAPDEDFVEMISMMLIEGKEAYEAILQCETNATSRALLRQKEQLVVQYFQESYGIDFYELQTMVQEAINKIAPDNSGGGDTDPEPVSALWGFDKIYQAIKYDLSVLPEPADIVARYNYDNNLLHQYGFALDYNFKLYYSMPDELTLTLYYHTTDTPTPEYYSANFWFYLPPSDDGTIDMWFSGGDVNAGFLQYEVKATALLAFFANRMHTVDWVESCSGERYVGVFPADDPESYVIGTLGN